MADDAWENSDEEPPADETGRRDRPPSARHVRSNNSHVTAEEARAIARQAVTRSWEEVGVDFTSFEKRQEIGSLFAWMRDRKRIRESGQSKIWTTAIGAIVSAIIAGLATFLSGTHKP